jgi:cytochrome P450
MLVRPLFGWVKSLPFGLGDWYTYTDLGWPTEDGTKTVDRLGDTFVLVTPTRNQICTTYPPAVSAIYKDVKNWIMPDPFSQVFSFYGQNVSSTNGVEWQRHRKITAPAFNDQTMHYVWEESAQRTVKDLKFLSRKATTLADMRSDVNILAMNVLVAVGFGQDTELSIIPPGHRESLMDSLGFIVKNVFVAVLFASLKAPDLILPRMLRQLKLSVSEFRLYMEEAVLRQLQTKKSSKPSLLQAMVDANEAEKTQLQKASERPSYLTNTELYGNLFVFNLAGYETTAGTMTFALPYLALHPAAQEWVIEEVDKHFKNSANPAYSTTYPKLVRCMAFMYETLRLAGPAPQMIRTPIVPTTIPIASPDEKHGPILTSLTVQPDTLITAHFYAMHLSDRWGPRPQLFDPKRFIRTDPATGEEELAMPADKGLSAMCIPWVMGPRICPGKKFSQVEFVAVVAQILSEYRIDVDVDEEKAETLEQARDRLSKVLDEKYFNISAHIRRPEDAGLRFLRRR